MSRSLLRDQAYEALRDAIEEGVLEPGERLNEADLVGWLGISRTPIREALTRLERGGLIETTPGRLTRVSPLTRRRGVRRPDRRRGDARGGDPRSRTGP